MVADDRIGFVVCSWNRIAVSSTGYNQNVGRVGCKASWRTGKWRCVESFRSYGWRSIRLSRSSYRFPEVAAKIGLL